MQADNLKSPENSTLSKNVKRNVKEIAKDVVCSVLSGVLREAKTGTADLVVILEKYVEVLEKDTFEFPNILNCEVKISPQANTLFSMVEKQSLSFKRLLRKYSLAETDGEISAFDNLDSAQQQRVLTEISSYLGKWIRTLNPILKTLWSISVGAIIVGVSFLLYKIAKSDNPCREVTKIIFTYGPEFFVGFIGLKICALLGICGGPLGIVVGAIIGVIGGIIGKYCGKGLFKLACKIFFPKSVGGPGQPPIHGTDSIFNQPHIIGTEKVFGQPALGCVLTRGQPNIIGANAAYGLPKLW